MSIYRSTRRWQWTLTDNLIGGPPSNALYEMERFYHQPGPELSVAFPGSPATILHTHFSPQGEPGLGDAPPFPSPSPSWPTYFSADSEITTGWGLFLYISQAVVGTTLLEAVVGRYDPNFNLIETVTTSPAEVGMKATFNETGPIFLAQQPGLLQNLFGDKPVRASDIVGVRLSFTRSGSKSAATMKYRVGDAYESLLLSPFPMPNPKIVWNGNLLQFPHPPTSYRKQRKSTRNLLFSEGGVAETVTRSKYDEVAVSLDRFTDATFEADLRAWWAWASNGESFSFSLDGADDVEETLTVQAEPGTSQVVLSGISGIALAKRYRLRTVDGREEEIVLVDDLPGGNVVDFGAQTLKYQYPVGSTFRSVDHFPQMIALNEDDPVTEHTTNFSLSFTMREDTA